MKTLTIIIKDVANMDEFIDDIHAFLAKKDILYKLNVDVESEPESESKPESESEGEEPESEGDGEKFFCCYCQDRCEAVTPWCYCMITHLLCNSCMIHIRENIDYSHNIRWNCKDANKCKKRYYE